MTALLEHDLDELPAGARRPVLRPSDVTNLAGTETGRHTLSHTRISVWLACHRKFELDYLRRLELIERPRYFSLGTAYQKAIEFQDPEVGVRLLNGFEPCEKCEGSGTTFSLRDLTGPCPACDGKSYTGEQVIFHTQQAEDRHRVDEAVVRAASTLYLQRWPSPPAGSTREFEYRVRLRSPWTGAYSQSYDLLGYADEVIDPFHTAGLLPPDGGTWSYADDDRPEVNPRPLRLIENKLVGRVDGAMVKALPLDRQLALARYGLWRATGRPVDQVSYRWIKKPSIRQREGRKADKSDAETLDQFVDRIAADYQDRPDFYIVEEEPKFVTTGDLLRIEADLWEIAEDMRQRMRTARDGRRRAFDRNTSRCADYGGCQFVPICTGDHDAPALYQVRPKRAVQLESAPEAEE